MKKLYIIPGFKEKCSFKPYRKLKKIAEEKGYSVVCHNIDFKKLLSKQIIPIEKDAVVFGFSVGALLARLIAQKYPCKKLILASSTQIRCLFNKKDKKTLSEILGEKFVNDIAKNIDRKTKLKGIVTIQ
jgi:pimeloyl-ACP methyl ester carboxylesterase